MTSQAPSPRSSAEAGCGTEVPAAAQIADVSLASTDGVTLSGAAVGSGARGVVMLHQTNNGICGWLPYAGQLAQQGFNVLLFDRRCEGGSSCADGDNAFDHAADVKAAVADLRRRGADKVAVVGASLGGSIALGACTVVEVDGCVALSPAQFDIQQLHQFGPLYLAREFLEVIGLGERVFLADVVNVISISVITVGTDAAPTGDAARMW